MQIRAIMALLGASCLLAGCPAPKAKKEDTTDKPAKAKTSPMKKASMPAAKIEVPPGTGPVAKVNEVEISRDRFNREFRQTLERYQRARHDVKPALRERLKDNIVRRLVDEEIIRQQATKMKIEIPTKEKEEKWAGHKKRYGSEEQFKAFLERSGTSEPDVRRQFESNLLREKVFAKVSESITVTPEDIKAFYEKNQARYDEPEQVKASHILIRVQRDATEVQKKAAKKRAEDVLKKAKAKGADFAALAKQFGEDPTKDRGGDLGPFTKGRMVKPFEEAVWTLKKGQVTPKLVETQFGFHIIKKTDHLAARKKPFNEAKEQIDRSLKARKRNTAIREALESWKKEAKIEKFVKGDQSIINAGRRVPPGKFSLPQKNRPKSLIDPKKLKLQKIKPPDLSTKPVKAKPVN